MVKKRYINSKNEKGDTAIYLDDIDEILFLINELKVAFDDIDREFLDEWTII